MLKLLLPPNFPAAAERDAIPVRLQLDLGQAPASELLPALAVLQRLCGNGPPPPFIQLTREQMRELMGLLRGQPVFAYVRTPDIALEWQGDGIPALSRFLTPPQKAEAPAGGAGGSKVTGGLHFRRSEPEAASTGSSGGLVEGTEHYLAITMPSRERPGYPVLMDLLKTSGFSLEPSNRKWWLRDRSKVLAFLAKNRKRLQDEFRLEFSETFVRQTRHIGEVEVACAVVESGGDYSLTLALRAGGVPERDLRSALASGLGHVEHQGRIWLLDAGKVAALTQAQRSLAGDPGVSVAPVRSMRVRSGAVAEVSEIIEELAPGFEPPESWRRRSEALRNLSSLPLLPLSDSLRGVLRPYQRLGASWLWYLKNQGLGGILADEMGLGKTLQALALLSAPGPAAGRGEGFSLVVAPASLLENWRRESARFAPGLRVFVHHAANRINSADTLRDVDLIVTSYGTLARDAEFFASLDFSCVVADEAQHIKNRRSLNARSLRSLHAKARFLLTGTPLENSLEDLRSLFEFLMPGYLPALPPGLRGDERQFHDRRMLAKTAHYILRRTKQAVAPELPPRIEQVLWCEMSEGQAALYRQTQEAGERELYDLEGAGASEARLRFAMLTQLLRLRQICCDPRLAKASASEASSAKVDALVELLEEAVDDGHRVLVFSQFTTMLDLLAKQLDELGLSQCRLDGSMTAKARQAQVDRFQANADIPVFLLSLKAGGTGLNLTGADMVVHFDPWWNPAAEMQATDRAHRIGQTRTVTSYKLICSGTVEEKVLALQDQKRALLAEVFEASDEAASKLGLEDLRGLLKT